jgi:hypothetical protein
MKERGAPFHFLCCGAEEEREAQALSILRPNTLGVKYWDPLEWKN